MSTRAVVATLLAAALAAPAGAQSVFTSRSAFNTASSAQNLTSSTIDFSAQVPAGPQLTVLPQSFTAGGVTFAGRSVTFPGGPVAQPSCIVQYGMNGFFPQGYNWGTGAVYSPQGFGCGATLGNSLRSTVSLTMGATRAFGIDYGMLNWPGGGETRSGTLAATFFSGTSVLDTRNFTFTSVPGAAKQFEFFGFLSTAAFDRVDLTFDDAGSGRLAIFDNVTTGVGAPIPDPVPEPSTVILLAAGGAGLVIAGARRRRLAA